MSINSPIPSDKIRKREDEKINSTPKYLECVESTVSRADEMFDLESELMMVTIDGKSVSPQELFCKRKSSIVPLTRDENQVKRFFCAKQKLKPKGTPKTFLIKDSNELNNQ